jgi:hypothetical protein
VDREIVWPFLLHFRMNLNRDHNLQEIESLKKAFPTSEEQSKLLQDCNIADTIPCILDDNGGAVNRTKLYVSFFFRPSVILRWRIPSRDAVHKF